MLVVLHGNRLGNHPVYVFPSTHSSYLFQPLRVHLHVWGGGEGRKGGEGERGRKRGEGDE